MPKKIPSIEQHMTASPHATGLDQPLSYAHSAMKRFQIRHLPVLSGGVLVGVLSDRDLHLIETLRDVDPEKVTVEEAMSTSIYSVAHDTPLDEVVETMAERKYGCAVVMRDGHVAGIFTTVDACRSLAELLRAG